MLNDVTIMGWLGRDPELLYTRSGIPVVNVSLAVDRDYKNKVTGERVTDWIDVRAWRHTARFLCRYFGKGRLVVIRGRLRTDRWMDDEGRNRYRTIVEADDVYFAGGAKASAPQTAAQAYDTYAPRHAEAIDPQMGIPEYPDADRNLPF